MKKIIVDINDNQSRIALVEDKELKEFYIERENNKRIVGNIYKGKVENVLPGMQAAFIDIGIEKNAFLYIKDTTALIENSYDNEKDMPPINKILKRGQEFMVQVIKEPIDQKGARVTTNITIPGRYIVLMPTVDYIGISRRIEDSEERERLKCIAQEIKEPGIGLIVRTEAEGLTKQDLIQDWEFLTNVWEKIQKKNNIVSAPKLIHGELELTYRTVRDLFTKDIDKFIINNREHFKKVLDMIELASPSLKERVVFFGHGEDIFSHYNITSQIDEMLSKEVHLKCGGYIVIDRTEALTVIDVNTGKFVGSIDLQDTVLRTNLQAAEEIAKQLRLRNIGGIIIIDFIDMKNPQDEEKVLNRLEDALKQDKTRTNVMGITQLGLVELTRKKVRKSIGKILQDFCPLCEGTGQVLSFETMLTEIDQIFKRNPHFREEKIMCLLLNPYTALRLEQGHRNILRDLESKYHIMFQVASDETLSPNQLKLRKYN